MKIQIPSSTAMRFADSGHSMEVEGWFQRMEVGISLLHFSLHFWVTV